MRIINLLSLLLCLVVASNLHAQVNKKNVIYSYDVTGNRMTRSVINTLNKKSNDTTYSKKSQEDDLIVANNNGNLMKLNLTIYPNPVLDILMIKLSGISVTASDSLLVKYILFDLFGRVVYEKSVTKMGDDTMEVGHLTTGFYFLNIVTNHEIKSYRIVKI